VFWHKPDSAGELRHGKLQVGWGIAKECYIETEQTICITKQSIDPERRYAELVETLTKNSAVKVGSAKKGFGSAALQINNKIFAMLSSKGNFVVKLPRIRVDSLVASGSGKRFDPGHGRLMKEWLALEPTSDEDWLELAGEAMNFVGSVG
jgi:hypothetical protein